MPKSVDDCVKALMANPDFEPQEGKTKEDSAWAVCQTQHKAQGGIILEQITEPVNFIVAQEESGEVLRFTNAILVVAETNRNQDTITEEGISEICASLPGRPIDWDHEFTKNVGVFTGARAVKLENTWAASTDGIIWADRFPQAADGVRNGTLHLSIEARAETAQCSVCDGVFGEVVEYCQHLLNKVQSGANRILKGLKAIGGALTEKPAGTGTTFDQSKVYFVANHQEEVIAGQELTTKTQKAPKGDQIMTLEEVQAQLDQMTKSFDEEVAARKQAQTELATAQEEASTLQTKVEEVPTLQAKVEELTSEVEEVNTKLSETITAHRVEVLTLTGMDEDEVKEATETISKMDPAAFNLFLAHVRKPATKQKLGSGGLSHDGDDKPKLVLGGVA